MTLSYHPSHKCRHFLDIRDLNTEQLRNIINAAKARKLANNAANKLCTKGFTDPDSPLKGYALAMVFEKPSTRTRISFEMAMHQLGGTSLILQGSNMQLGRGESVEDTARVMSRFVDAIMIRAHDHGFIKSLARSAQIPIINALTNRSHPCQIIADIMTIEEKIGLVTGQKFAWIGDGNNVAVSLIEAAVRLNFSLTLACPPEYAPSDDILAWAEAEGGAVTLTSDAYKAVNGASAVFTDTWVSMGDTNQSKRLETLSPYQVTEKLMAAAAPNALFLHCLPAHRGEEVTSAVIDGPQSAVWDEAENRLHAQKAVLLWCLTGKFL